MYIVPPVTITDTEFYSSNVPETDEAEYNSGTTYALGDLVMRTVTDTHRVYRSLQNSNTGNTPENSPTWWQDLGATNRWKMFDGATGSSTSNAVSITVEVDPGVVFNSVVLFGLVGVSLQIIVTDPTDGEVYNETVSLVDSPWVVDAYTYGYSPFFYIGKVAKMDLPAYATARLKIIITAESGLNAECGQLVVGTSLNLGVSIFGTDVGFKDYSIKETDEFGNPYVVQRKTSDECGYSFRVQTANIAAVRSMIRGYSATPVAWIADANRRETINYGWPGKFRIPIEYPDYSPCNLNVEELS